MKKTSSKKPTKSAQTKRKTRKKAAEAVTPKTKETDLKEMPVVFKEVTMEEAIDFQKLQQAYNNNPLDSGLGLGDAVAAVTAATGIDKAVKAVAKTLGYDDCGCDERQERLNKHRVLRGFKLECITEPEYNFLTKMFDPAKNKFDSNEQHEMKRIYERVFNVRLKTTCTPCSFKTRIYKPLSTYYKNFNTPVNE